MRRELALALGVLVLAGLQAPSAEEIYSRHCLAGCPTGAPDSNELVIREIYVLSNNPQTKWTGDTRPRSQVSPTLAAGATRTSQPP